MLIVKFETFGTLSVSVILGETVCPNVRPS